MIKKLIAVFFLSCLCGAESNEDFFYERVLKVDNIKNVDVLLADNTIVDKIFYRNNIGFYRLKDSSCFVYTYDSTDDIAVNPYFKAYMSNDSAQDSILSQCWYLYDTAEDESPLVRYLANSILKSNKFYNVCTKLVRVYVWARNNTIDIYHVGSDEEERGLLSEIFLHSNILKD